MISKPLKPLSRKHVRDEEKNNSTKLGRFKQKLIYLFKMYLYYPVDSFIGIICERVSRSWAFAKHGYMHYDFESAYLYDLMAFKMKRIYKTLDNGHAWQSPADMKALKEAIKICERLFAGNYDDKYYKAHAKKWGKFTFKNKSKKEIKDLRKIWVKEEQDRQNDLNRLNEILVKHEPTWWD